MKSKKTLIVASLMLSSVLALGACGDKDEITKDVTNNNTGNDIEDNAPGDDEADTGNAFEFRKFELEVDTPEQEEAIKVNYEEEKDSTDAEYTNTAEDLNLTGDDAMAKLEPILHELTIGQDMSDEVITEHVMKSFGIEDTYKKVEIEIIWLNDEKKEIEVIK